VGFGPGPTPPIPNPQSPIPNPHINIYKRIKNSNKNNESYYFKIAFNSKK
jgi:hypothetical protein